MKTRRSRYYGHRFPAEIISYAVWIYHRFSLSFRDIEDLFAERGITVSYETIRQWCQKFGPPYACRLRRRQGRLGATWHLDELFVKINGQRQYLWRAVDQDGDVIDVLVQPRRDPQAAQCFFQRLLKGQGEKPFRLVTDKLASYRAAHRVVMPRSCNHPTAALSILQCLASGNSGMIFHHRQSSTSKTRPARGKLTIPAEGNHIAFDRSADGDVAGKCDEVAVRGAVDVDGFGKDDQRVIDGFAFGHCYGPVVCPPDIERVTRRGYEDAATPTN